MPDTLTLDQRAKDVCNNMAALNAAISRYISQHNIDQENNVFGDYRVAGNNVIKAQQNYTVDIQNARFYNSQGLGTLWLTLTGRGPVNPPASVNPNNPQPPTNPSSPPTPKEPNKGFNWLPLFGLVGLTSIVSGLAIYLGGKKLLNPDSGQTDVLLKEIEIAKDNFTAGNFNTNHDLTEALSNGGEANSRLTTNLTPEQSDALNTMEQYFQDLEKATGINAGSLQQEYAKFSKAASANIDTTDGISTEEYQQIASETIDNFTQHVRAQAPSSGPLATLQDTWNQMTFSLGDRWHQFASGFGGSVNAAEIPEGAVPLPNAPTITASTSTPETWGFGLDLDIGQGLGAFSAVMATVQLMGTWKTINTKERLLLAAQATAGALAAAGKVNPFLSASLLAVNTVRASTKDAYEEKTKTFQSATNNFTKVCNQQAQTTPEKVTKCARIALGAVQVWGSWVSAAQSMVANAVKDIGRTQEDKVVQPMLTQKASEVQAFVAHKTQDTLQTLQDKTSAMGAQAQKVANDAAKMAKQTTQATMESASNMLQSAKEKANNLFASWFKGPVEAGA